MWQMVLVLMDRNLLPEGRVSKSLWPVGMRIVNRFCLGIGSESNDSLESLTKTLYDSAIDSSRAAPPL